MVTYLDVASWRKFEECRHRIPAPCITEEDAQRAAGDGTEGVIKLATKISFTGRAAEFDEANVKGTRRLLHCARAARARDVVFVSSPSVDNAAAAIVAALHRIPRPWQGTGGEQRRAASGERAAGGHMRCGGVPAPSWSVSGPVARAAGAVVEKLWTVAGRDEEPPMTRFLAGQLSTAHWFDQRKTRKLLDSTPAVSIDAGLARLAEHYSS